jgi:hypothetical protein
MIYLLYALKNIHYWVGGRYERERTHASRWIAALKFLPLLVFGILVILCKLDLLIAAPIATMTAIFPLYAPQALPV